MAIVKGAGLVMKAIIEVRVQQCYVGQRTKYALPISEVQSQYCLNNT